MRALALSLLVLALLAGPLAPLALAQSTTAPSASLLLGTDAAFYEPGRAVLFLVKNNGTVQLNGTLRLEVVDQAGKVVFTHQSQVALAPGAMADRRWDQRTPEGPAAAPGDYRATAFLESPSSATRLSAAWGFRLVPGPTQPSPPPPEPPRLSLRTDAPRYALGAGVTFLLTNVGNRTLEGSPGIEVRGPQREVVWRPFVTEAAQSLAPGSSIPIAWDQRTDAGTMASPGAYSALATFAGGTAFAGFWLGNDTAAQPPIAPPPRPPATVCCGVLDVLADPRDAPLGAAVRVVVANPGKGPLEGPFTVEVSTLRMEPVRTLAAAQPLRLEPGTRHAFAWDQRTDDGQPARPGCYLALASLNGQRDSEPFATGGAVCSQVPQQPAPQPRPAGKAVTTSLASYAPGERVVVRVTNLFDKPLQGDLELEVRDGAGLRSLAVVRTFGVALGAGASLEVPWDQRDSAGRQVPRGCYVASVRLAGLADAHAFGIVTGECAAKAVPAGYTAPGPAPVTWEDRAAYYWQEKYPEERDLRASWADIEARLRDTAGRWDGALGKAPLLRAAEGKGIFGGFQLQTETGAVTGPMVRFAYDTVDGTLRALDVRRGDAWARVAERVAVQTLKPLDAPLAAGPLFLHEGEAAVLQVHHSASPAVVHRAPEGGNLLTYTLPPGTRAEMLGPHAVAFHGQVEALLVLMGPGNLTLAGSDVSVKLAPFASATLLVLDRGADPPWDPDAREAIARAVASGAVGGEITLVAGGGQSGEAVIPYNAVQLRALAAEPGRVVVGVDSDLREGKVIVLNLDASVLGGAELRVLLDGADLTGADDLADALTHTEGEGAEYYVVQGRAGVQVVVQMPRFSPHTLEVLSLPPEVVQPLLTTGLLAGLGLLVGLGALMLRRPRTPF
jgi:hypothetical protein